MIALIVMASVVIVSCQKQDSSELGLRQGAQEQVDERKAVVDASQNKLEAAIRAATAKYQRFEVALADGYELDPHCAAHPELGGMGFHAVNFGLVSPVVDPLKPQALVYEPMKNGKLRLVAVEYIMPAEIWDDYNDGPPMLGLVEFNDHRAPGSGGPPIPHYQLHVWLWKNNPSGMYFPFNPNVSCEYSYLVEF